MQEFLDVEQERQKTHFDRNRFGSSFKVAEVLLVFIPTVKRAKQGKLPLSREEQRQ